MLKIGEKNKFNVFAVLLLLAASFLVYSNTLGNDFVIDDIPIIRDNPIIRDIGDAGQIFSRNYWWPTTNTGFYRPIPLLSYAVNYHFSGLEVMPYHLVNILLHGIASILVFLLAREVFRKKTTALLAGLIFAVHPIHTEAVAGIVGRAELFAAIFGLAALLLYIKSHSMQKPSGRVFLSASVFLFFLALLSKENAIVFLPIAMLHDFSYNYRNMRHGFARNVLANFLEKTRHAYLLFLAPVAAWLALRGIVFSQAGEITFPLPLSGLPPLALAFTSMKIVAAYLWMLFFPLKLSVSHSLSSIGVAYSFLEPGFLFSLALLLATLGSMVFFYRKNRNAFFPIAWFFAAIAPASNFFALIGIVLAERALYLPSIGFCLLAALGFSRFYNVFGRRSNALKLLSIALPLLLLFSFSALTIKRNFEWRDSFTIWSSAERADPLDPKAKNALALQHKLNGRMEMAVEKYNEGLAIEGRPGTHFGLGTAYLAMGENDLAAVEFGKAIAMNPRNHSYLEGLGGAYHARGMNGEAIAAYLRALEINPSSSEAHNNLAVIYVETGDWGLAEQHFKTALTINPYNAEIQFNLGLLYFKQGDFAGARAYWETALALDPNFEKAKQSLEMIAWNS